MDCNRKIIDIFNHGREYERLPSHIKSLCRIMLETDSESEPREQLMDNIKSSFERYHELYSVYPLQQTNLGSDETDFVNIADLYDNTLKYFDEVKEKYEERLEEERQKKIEEEGGPRPF